MKFKYVKSGAKRRLVEKPDTFQYVPLLDNLQWLLLNRDISDQVCIIILRLLEDMFMEIIMCRYFVIELPLAMSV